MIYAGIDAGSRTIKVVLVDSSGAVVGRGIADQGVKQAALCSRLLEDVVAAAGYSFEQVQRTVATGYGREAFKAADESVTEITCQAKGVRHLVPTASTIIDVGGQDCKILRLTEAGTVRDFITNDRCAAGTGRFLEMMATRLELELERLGEVARQADCPAVLNSTCAVFAETELIGLLASGHEPANIVSGALAAVAARIVALSSKRTPEPILLTGGAAKILGLDRALATALGQPVMIAPDPQHTGALGAAMLACAYDHATTPAEPRA